jgi:hypothetical protein
MEGLICRLEMERVRWGKARVLEEVWKLAEAEGEWEAAVLVQDLQDTVYALSVVLKYLISGVTLATLSFVRSVAHQ